MNTCGLSGNIVRDGEKKFENNGKCVHHFTLAVNKSRKINGEWMKITSFLDCTYYASVKMADRIKKGQLASIAGEISQQRWKDKNTGQPRNRIVIECRQVDIHLKREDHNSTNPDYDPGSAMDNPGNYNTAPTDDYVPTGDAPDGGPDYY